MSVLAKIIEEVMTNKKFWLVIALILSMAVIDCDNGSTNVNDNNNNNGNGTENGNGSGNGDNNGGGGDPPSVTEVTVSPANITVGKGQTLPFNATVTGTNSPAQTVTWTVTGGGSGTSINSSGLLTVADNEAATALTVKATSTVDTTKSGTATVTVVTAVLWYVHDTATWGEAVNGIRSGGDDIYHIITVSGDISIPVTPYSTFTSENTFGSVTGITVNIEGSGTISVSGSGTGGLLQIGADQTIIVTDLTLRGRSSNTNPVVRVFNTGTFCMEGSALVTGNTSSSNGGGVYVDDEGTFIMQDNAAVSGNTANSRAGGVYVYSGTFAMKDNASVSDNTASGYGGGVYVYAWGTFTMQDNATVSGNTVSSSGYGGSIYGGGVYVYGGNSKGTFTMDGGTISNNIVSASGSSSSASGGGVYAEDAEAFIMKGGTITGNTVSGTGSAYGGGVRVYSGTFTMQSGTISNNNVSAINTSSRAEALGGGVCAAVFIMQSGTISGNTVTGNGRINATYGIYAQGGGVYTNDFTMEDGIISGNTVSGSNSYSGGDLRVFGGGVYCGTFGTFTKTGGTIYGNAEADNLRNIAIGGQGHAAAKTYDNWRNATAGSSMNSDSYGFWLNEVDITYTVTPTVSATTSSFLFTFSEDPGNLLASHITLDENVSRESATITGSGTTRTLSPLSISGNGIVEVSILSMYKVATGSQKIYIIPETPTGVVTVPSASTVTVRWNPVFLTAGYRVYRSTSASGTYTPIVTTASDLYTTSSTSYTDINLSKTTSYYYRVTAYNSAGESVVPAQVSATTLDDNTQRAIPVSSDTIVIEWPQNTLRDVVMSITNIAFETVDLSVLIITAGTFSPGSLSTRTSYVIYRNEERIGEIEIPTYFGLIQDSSKLDHFFVDDKGLKPNTTYNYRVAANVYVNYGLLGNSSEEKDDVIKSISVTTLPDV